ncbi:unnamed protein product [Allacma fusca]|uniref:DUF4806 domain-containing protein n=1 Tax=Allacma fusca TaxID=39272 RepID=A0A8J2JCQ7_9HEXA|nr:unnamed protein product [Allacma fusca]
MRCIEASNIARPYSNLRVMRNALQPSKGMVLDYWTESEGTKPTPRTSVKESQLGFQLVSVDPCTSSEEEFLEPIGANQGQQPMSQIACGSKFVELEGSQSSGKLTNRNTLTSKSTLLPENFNLLADTVPAVNQSDELEIIKSENRKFYKLVLTKLTSIEEDIASIKKLQLSSQQEIDNFDDIPSLPLQSQDDFNSLETWLQCSDNRTKLKNYLYTIGGKSGEAAIREILKKVLSPTFTRFINWSGQNEKGDFGGKFLRQVITDAARKRFTDLTDDSAKSVYINWFRNSQSLTLAKASKRNASK